MRSRQLVHQKSHQRVAPGDDERSFRRVRVRCQEDHRVALAPAVVRNGSSGRRFDREEEAPAVDGRKPQPPVGTCRRPCPGRRSRFAGRPEQGFDRFAERGRDLQGDRDGRHEPAGFDGADLGARGATATGKVGLRPSAAPAELREARQVRHDSVSMRQDRITTWSAVTCRRDAHAERRDLRSDAGVRRSCSRRDGGDAPRNCRDGARGHHDAGPTGGASCLIAGCGSPRQDGPIPLNVAFHCEPGQILALFGPSGSGKTTVLRTIACLYTPTRAHVSVDGDIWLDTVAVLFFSRASNRLPQFYVAGGIGSLWWKEVAPVVTVTPTRAIMSELMSDDTALAIDAGAGLRLEVTESVAIWPEFRYYDSTLGSRANLSLTRFSIAAGYEW